MDSPSGSPLPRRPPLFPVLRSLLMSRSRVAAMAAVVSAVALVGAGCGSSDQSSSQAAKPGPSRDSAAAKVRIEIAAPVADATVRTPRVVVRGTVTPPDAAVQITGLTAAVANGVFHRSIPVTPGQNSIDVVATKAGLDPVTTSLSVKRGQSEAQLAQARA